MSVWSDLKDGIRQIIRLESRIDQLNGAVDRLADQSLDHEKRLINVATREFRGIWLDFQRYPKPQRPSPQRIIPWS